MSAAKISAKVSASKIEISADESRRIEISAEREDKCARILAEKSSTDNFLKEPQMCKDGDKLCGFGRFLKSSLSLFNSNVSIPIA